MPLIKEVKPPTTKAQSRVQTAAWVFIYGGLLTLITGYTLGLSDKSGVATAWTTAHTLMLLGGLATALGVLLIYVRSLMK
jgi:hypothetical protein